MQSGSSARKDGPRIAVGVYDEPELIVAGVDSMLARNGSPTEVVPVAPDSGEVAVDVLLCDPVGRAVQIEDYLALVASITVAPLLVFTWGSSPSSVSRSMASGAKGVVSKAASAADLATAIAAVHNGETIAPARLPAPQFGVAELSHREAALVCRGMSNLEIAEQLFVSVNSVKTYVRQIYQKIGVARRTQAVAWGLSHGF